MSKEDIKTMASMLAHRRPAGSVSEQAFIDRFLNPLGVQTDQFGNRYLVVGDDLPIVLWSSHTDSVHDSDGMQKIHFDGRYFRLPPKSKSSCLGADCAAGVWVMIEMIKANVPGLYVFHHAEEIGCIGSGAIAKHTPGFLNGIKAAIAFDRRRDFSVITHQGKRCCSDAFGESMLGQLPKRFKLDPGGFITDTKKYMGLVPECSNLSVGFQHEHTPGETLDTKHLLELRDHMVRFDQSKLVIERDPAEDKIVQGLGSGAFPFGRLFPDTLYDLVYHYPNHTTKFLQSKGITFDELDAFIGNADNKQVA